MPGLFVYYRTDEGKPTKLANEQFDVTIIGSGPGGYVAAIRAGQQARSLVPTFSPNKRPAALEQIRTTAAQSSILGEFEPAVSHSRFDGLTPSSRGRATYG